MNIIKTLTSFFRFYWYFIISSKKRFDITFDPYQFTASCVTPFIIWAILVFTSIIPIDYLFLGLPISLLNIFIIWRTMEKGYKLKAGIESWKKRKERERKIIEDEIARIIEELERLQQKEKERRYREYQRQNTYIDPNIINAMKLLNLKEGFTMQDLKKSYKQLAKIHHPDVGGTAENFKRLNKAYNYLIERM